jgi:predicted nucleic acid-binding protein
VNRLVNTTVLSNFAAVRQLDLLRKVIGSLYLPTEVFGEILAGRLAGYAFYDGIEQHVTPISQSGWLHLVSMTPDELQQFVLLPPHLERGEAACLCMARQRGWGFLTDDRAARQKAREWDIPLSGTIGVLLLAILDGHLTLSEGNALLQQMIAQANYRSPTLDLGSLLP